MDVKKGGGLVLVPRRLAIRPGFVNKRIALASGRGQAQGPRIRSTLPPVPTDGGAHFICFTFSLYPFHSSETY